MKVHCSVLATDALKEAIYDYFLKSKRKILLDLKKYHLQMQRQEEGMKKKYKEWVETEEKMHGENKS